MNSEQQIDIYLSLLSVSLGSISATQREEILREISAHIRDCSEESGVSTREILTRLGLPQNLAASYLDGAFIQQASRSFSPVLLLRATLRLGTKGAFGILVGVCGFVGYVMGGSLLLTAIAKCLFPVHTGLWLIGNQMVSSGTLFPIPQSPAREVLGWWYLPIALIAGSLTLVLTTYAIRKSLRVSQSWQTRLAATKHNLHNDNLAMIYLIAIALCHVGHTFS